MWVYYTLRGSGSSVGIATNYGMDGTGIESRWGRDFPPVQTAPGAHPASCRMGTGSFPGVKCGRSVCWPLTPFQCRGHGRVELYLSPPSGSHRACNGITLPLPLYHTLQSHAKCDSMLILAKNEYVIFLVTFAIFQGKNVTAVEGYLVIAMVILSKHQNIVWYS